MTALGDLSKKVSRSEPRPDLGAPMSFRDHLRELRKRLVKALLAVFIGLTVGLSSRSQFKTLLIRLIAIALLKNVNSLPNRR